MALIPTLYLVRHLAPQVEAGVCYGRTDLAVAPGRMAEALPALREQLPAGLPVYSSPLRRCAELAAALAGGKVVIDARLSELDFGSWEMRAWDGIPKAEIDAWAADLAGYRPGGAENVTEMAERISAFHAGLPPEPAIVICHAGAIRLLAACRSGLAPRAMAIEAAAKPHAIAYGEIVVMPGV